jgi:hypothetical protein
MPADPETLKRIQDTGDVGDKVDMSEFVHDFVLPSGGPCMVKAIEQRIGSMLNARRWNAEGMVHGPPPAPSLSPQATHLWMCVGCIFRELVWVLQYVEVFVMVFVVVPMSHVPLR